MNINFLVESKLTLKFELKIYSQLEVYTKHCSHVWATNTSLIWTNRAHFQCCILIPGPFIIILIYLMSSLGSSSVWNKPVYLPCLPVSQRPLLTCFFAEASII